MDISNAHLRISAIDHTRRVLYYELLNRLENRDKTGSWHRADQDKLARELVELFMQGNNGLLQEVEMYRKAAYEMRWPK